MSTAIGVDIGTTAVKTVLIDDQAQILGEASAEHDLYSEQQGWAEEEPSSWWAGLCSSVSALLRNTGVHPQTVKAVGVSGMVPAIVLLDARLRVLRRSIQQQDARCVDEIAWLKQRIDQDELYGRTGGYTNQQHVLPRLLWVKRNEPDVFARVRYVMGSYDYMNLLLTGRPSLEVNWAVESGLFDIYNRSWIERYMAVGGIGPDLFPDVRLPHEVIGEICTEAARQTGLVKGTPVIAGSADHVASALAAGLREQGDTLVKFGGGGDVLFCTAKCVTHPKMFIDYHNIPGKYLVNGCMASSGSLVKWYVKQMVPSSEQPGALARLDAAAEQIRAASEGIVVLPYFVGEKTPLFDPLARGVFFGLSLHHTREHLFRAVLESVSYGFRHHLDELEQAGFVPTRVFGTNGGARSSLWRQITSDVLGRSMRVYTTHPGSAMGVAYVAAMASGMYNQWSDIDAFLHDAIEVHPDEKNHEIYRRAYGIYRDLYRHLRSDFRLLAELYE